MMSMNASNTCRLTVFLTKVPGVYCTRGSLGGLSWRALLEGSLGGLFRRALLEGCLGGLSGRAL